jgi:hypothetical protein
VEQDSHPCEPRVAEFFLATANVTFPYIAGDQGWIRRAPIRGCMCLEGHGPGRVVMLRSFLTNTEAGEFRRSRRGEGRRIMRPIIDA